jgi:hypothetical protein
MIVCNIPVSGSLKIKPARNVVVDRAYLLPSSKKQLTTEKLDGGASFIHLPKMDQPNKPFVIVLETRSGQERNEEQKAKT